MQAEQFLNAKIGRFPPYSLNSEVNLSEIKIKLDANESFIRLPDYILGEVQDKLKGIDFNRYPDPSAAALVSRFAAYLRVSENINPGADNIAAGNGSDELLGIIINLFASKGDRILIFEPDFVMYAFYGNIIEADIIRAQKGPALKIDWGMAADIIKGGGIKLAVFSNPCNPTGQLEGKKDVREFIELARDAGTVVVLDEVYMSFCEGRGSFMRDFLDYPNLIIIKSLSKFIGLAALRVGFALSNPVFINAIKTIKSPFNLSASSQKIAEVILGYPEYLAQNLQTLKQNKQRLEEEAGKIFAGSGARLHPTETNFILLETAHAAGIFEHLLAHKILVRNLNNKYLRITSGSAGENEELLECLLKYHAKHAKQK